MGEEHHLRPATIAARAGRPEAPGAGVNLPISMSSTFREGGEALYGRDDNPTWEAFESVLGSLEGGRCLAFGSGMAAISAVLETVPIGGTVVVAAGSYNGTRRWCADAAARGRIGVRLVDTTDARAAIAACDGAQLVWLESPTNPCLDLADLAAIAAGARAFGATVAVDNTLATPLLQRPLTLGADVVVHSVTKWLSGHSDLLMGAVVTADDALLEVLRSRRSLFGGIPGSVEAWLALRGLRTLPARLFRAQATAGELACRLAAHPAVSRVRYPGLPDDPGHALASAGCDGVVRSGGRTGRGRRRVCGVRGADARDEPRRHRDAHRAPRPVCLRGADAAVDAADERRAGGRGGPLGRSGPGPGRDCLGSVA